MEHKKVRFKKEIPEHAYNIGSKIYDQTDEYSQVSALMIRIFINKMNHREATAKKYISFLEIFVTRKEYKNMEIQVILQPIKRKIR